MPLLVGGDSLARNSHGCFSNPYYFSPQLMSSAVLLPESPFNNIIQCNEWKRNGPFVGVFPSATYPVWQNILPITRFEQLSLRAKHSNSQKKSSEAEYPTPVPLTPFIPLGSSFSKHEQNNRLNPSFILPKETNNTRPYGKNNINRNGGQHESIIQQLNMMVSTQKPDSLKGRLAITPPTSPIRLNKMTLQTQGKNSQHDQNGTLHEIGDLLARKRSSSWPANKPLKKKFLKRSEDNQSVHSYKNLEMDVANILVSDIPIPVVGLNVKENNSAALQGSDELDGRHHSSDSSVNADSDNSLHSDSENLCSNKGMVVFTCQQCGVSCATTDDLISHKAKHTNTNNFTFTCNVCTQVFRSTNGLQKHVEFHADDDHRYNCSFCFKPFGNKDSLEEHIINMHMSKRPHKCTYCPKAFRDPGSLQKHVRVHTGEKPYRCNACEKSFAEYSSLRKHLRVHTGEQPYKCKFCPKAFSISGNLQRHILIHTGERPYKCTDCTKAFNNPSHLRRHIKNLHSKLENQK